MSNECKGCIYEDSVDISIHLEHCLYCKHSYYDEFDRDIHKDHYTKRSENDE